MEKSNLIVKFFITILFIFLINAVFGENIAFAKNVPGISATVNKKSYNPGESGVLTISFKTGSKVKIPKDPTVTVEITSGNIEGQGLQDYSGDEGDYISGSKVRYNFTVPSGAESGSTINITGTVNFAYCTTTDGVCKLASKEFSAKVRVK